MTGLNGRKDARLIPVEDLVPGDSPRLGGENTEHTQLLAESEEPLPPILVHRATMKVIDGVHRWRAATQRGEQTIAVEYFDGDGAEAFVAAVKANAAHGLPLTLADRKAAAARIIASQAQYSDRAVAAVCGLAANTVSAIRRRTASDQDQGTPRIGRDGRVRPVTTADARRLAGEIITEQPRASLRTVARMAGLSPATVRDVRERVARGDNPVPPRQRTGDDTPGPVRLRDAEQGHRPGLEQRDTGPDRPVGRDRAALLRDLNRDPSLRFSEVGKNLLRWMSMRADGPEGWAQMAEAMPLHCAYLVAEVARDCAQEWLAFADQLDRRLRSTG